MCSTQEPLFSVVVVIVSDTTSRCDVSLLSGCLEALARQADPPPLEVIVPYHPGTEGVEGLRRRFPRVAFRRADDLKTLKHKGGSNDYHNELRARGLDAARGDLIGLLEDHARPDPHWCRRMVEAHALDYAAVGGAIENQHDRPVNWAVYFCDFGRYQNPLPEGETPCASDANITYKRSALEAVRPAWQEVFQETAVNGALRARGARLGLAPGAVVYQERGRLRLGRAFRERIIWARSFAAARGRLAGLRRRLIYAALAPALPLLLLGRMTGNALKKRRCRTAFFKSLPLTALLTVGWSWGEFTGYLTGRASPGAEDGRLS
jgi:hypothetical protein